ncbi:MAG: TetR/AcrR family transcriptional regulator [Sphingobacterium sp.]|uniref:Transcriptional regulator, TetR family n=1 Tax=Olivibacter domesticus TaxID=407022 RepID=A0A1H7MZF7_OLID1|nr:TetR/AcrR family transcriptional regulator [Olivibacter domesticus]SEL16095.1 transcriptional regulator, TetR family [Olivibacter domesticus]
MGIKERKERHKEDLRQRILDAAKVLFLKEGYDATSIRKIASAIEFSPTTIYLYYKDKNDIIYALQKEGFKLLRTKFSALSNVENPFERLKAMGRTYLQFSIENREFYELMFVMKEPLEFLENVCGEGEEEQWDEGVEAFSFLVHTIADCQQAGYFGGHDTRMFSLLIWSTVHGLSTLNMHGHITHVVEKHLVELQDGGQILEAAFNNYIKFLEQLKS